MRISILLLVLLLAAPSDHLDSPYIDNYPQRDIGDLFVWTGTQTGSPAFLINLNPLTPPGDSTRLGLDPSVLYEFKLDTDGDHVADLAYKVAVEGTITGPDDTQTITLYKAIGATADSNEVGGTQVAQGESTSMNASTPTVIEGTNGELLFVGARQDPFFFKFKGVMSPVALDLRFALSADGLPTDGSAANTFGPTNITAVVLEVPELKDRVFTAWATTSIEGEQQDRCGKSSVTAIFLPEVPTGRNPDMYPYGDLKQPYNETKPATDRETYGEAFSYRLRQVQVDEDRIQEVVDFFLPDVLSYDPAQPQAYPNGRSLEEDAVFWTLQYLNPFMAETDSTLQLPQTNPQPLTSTFPYAAPPLLGSMGATTAPTSCPWWHLVCHFQSWMS